ncbi:hypothetical protein GCM10023321_55800 [Pseudonocardia eucalypti]|uniref:Peptidase M10 metallopeptidase domain-containing protein n=1 Tax=Pseudonocardia eucalypti TaxID=648755 RepID=A0ABP9QQC6_9PSEU|nr:hypothetical protein [Pseudonocardia eucalypti]
MTGGEAVYAVFLVGLLVMVYLFADAFQLLREPDDGVLPIRSPATEGVGSYAFLRTTPGGRPVSFDRCRPVHYVVSAHGLPPDGVELVREAVDEVSERTGLTFVMDGVTSEVPRPRRNAARGYAQDWTPVLIAWADRADFPVRDTGQAGDVEGIALNTWSMPSGPESARFVSGQIVLFRDNLAKIATGRSGRLIQKAILLHELGHLVGLDHVSDPGELMAPMYTGLTGFGPGDRQGLAELGAVPCMPR